ncbi:auxin response factor 17-like [Typha angustifolia]|uniref:auxin response factor 17-like n=1 Tax=Typha angustifolia TaxID=59011 RepID=UPI003C2ED2DD
MAPMAQLPGPAKEPRSVDPHVWRACAGPSAWVPPVGSAVVYFPEGHAEQCSKPPDFSGGGNPAVPCRVIDVRYLANPDTEEVFCKIRLDPALLQHPPLAPAAAEGSDGGGGDGGVVSFAKILTPSDANNGGGFSVPRFCADSIFPALNMTDDPPVQNITVSDLQGGRWIFRHIYRGTPRRHLLTTGWSKFVNFKKLVAGDSVVFMKNQAGELFVGIRRTVRFFATAHYLPRKMEDSSGSGEGFSRNVRGRVPASTVVEAVKLAEMGRPFEVMYYPRSGSADFVVAREVVEAATSVRWTPGMRIKMPTETEDSSRMTWFQGTVSSVTVKETGPWARSPWRMLQVTWDEPDVLQNIRSVSPWQVELLTTTPQMQSPYPVLKKLRMSESSQIFGDGEGNMVFHMRGLRNNNTGDLTSQLRSYTSFPAGMQGARHDSICGPSLSNILPLNANRAFSDSRYGTDMCQNMNNVSNNMNIASARQSQVSHSPNQGSILGSDAEPLKAPEGGIRLFGMLITVGKSGDEKNDAEENKEEALSQYSSVSEE